LIFVVSGPGGVGKGTIVRRLLGQIDGLHLSRSWTTRPRRPGEDEGAYVWASEEDFEAKVAAGGFLEWNRLASNGSMYGTPLPDPQPGLDLLLEIELNGAAQVKKRYGDAVLIFVVPPSMEDLRARMASRGDDADSVARRIELGRLEMERGPAMADYVVVNDDLDRATSEVLGIVVSCRKRPS
jgi:guanylate kinase